MIEGLKVTSPSTCHVRGFFRSPCAEVGSPVSDTPPRWGMIEGLRVTLFSTCEGDIAFTWGAHWAGRGSGRSGLGEGRKVFYQKSANRVRRNTPTSPHHPILRHPI
jgi:hypothetical protein